MSEDSSIYLEATRRRKLEEIFRSYVSGLIVMAKDADSVRRIWRTKIPKDDRTKNKDGFLYAAQKLVGEIEAAICHEEYSLREEAEAEAREQEEYLHRQRMFILDGSRIRAGFPIEDRLQSASKEVFQARDFIYIIGVNEPSGSGRLEADVSALKKKTVRVLSEVAKRYPDEIKEVRIKGPKMCGKEAFIYHGNVLHLIGKYMEEQALQKTLYPPHGRISEEEVCLIVSVWNKMKRALVIDDNYRRLSARWLEMMGFPGFELIYTPDGLVRGQAIEICEVAGDKDDMDVDNASIDDDYMYGALDEYER